MTFRQAEKFSVLELQKALAQLLEAEYRLKGSQMPATVVIENFLMGLFMSQDQGMPTATHLRQAM
jgi:DNA polymerase III delta subunit